MLRYDTDMITTTATANLTYQLLSTDPATMARRGRVTTPRGEIDTPAFMPVGTQATVKTLLPEEVYETGARIILANTYHLMLRPGSGLLREAGGLHTFMQWPGPILTDSGGFQIFSLAQRANVRDDGVRFRSHIDGSYHQLTPERAISLQLDFGSDILMALDQCVGLPCDRKALLKSTARTELWLERCVAAFAELDGAARGASLFGISQGGLEADLRRESALVVAEADVAGCAIGGLSVGESKSAMAEMLEISMQVLPTGKPRYLMGVGAPEDLWNCVALGVDLFDCVLPTRLARNGALFTPEGRINIRSSRYRSLHEPLDRTCDCATCRRFTAAYLHHLFRAGEVLGLRLASVHNLRFLARQMEHIRAAIEQGTFPAARSAFLDRYQPTRLD